MMIFFNERYLQDGTSLLLLEKDNRKANSESFERLKRSDTSLYEKHPAKRYWIVEPNGGMLDAFFSNCHRLPTDTHAH